MVIQMQIKLGGKDARKITAMLAIKYRRCALDCKKEHPFMTIKKCYEAVSFMGEDYYAAKEILEDRQL